MGALIPLVLSVAPTIAKWLFGADGDKVAEQIVQTVASVTGVPDPHSDAGADAARSVLQSRPELAMQLQVELARIAAEREVEADRASEAARKAELEALAQGFADTANARQQTIALAQAGSSIAWGAPVVSALVLITFAAVMTLALTRSLPAGSETILNMLLGSLAAMATSVVSYWVGSSAGSARKDEHIARLASRQGDNQSD
jgi:hypothetical protein